MLYAVQQSEGGSQREREMLLRDAGGVVVISHVAMYAVHGSVNLQLFRAF